MDILNSLPPDFSRIMLVLFLSFLIGLEREEHKSTDSYSFGGVRTFPLIGLVGYAVALLSGAQVLPLIVGFLVIASFLLISYWHKIAHAEAAGVTTEISGLATFIVGALIFYGHLWTATAISVASLLLLDLKAALERLAVRIAPNEILTFAKFLLLSGVILPVLPNQNYTSFHINPFKTWLVVVAISAISYASYVLQKLAKGQGGIVLAALLGGAYSSTVTTVVLARRARQEDQPHAYAGCILIASGVMYLRLIALLALFNHALMLKVIVPFLVLAAGAAGFGWLWSRRADRSAATSQASLEPKNPLDLLAAFFFAALFLAMLVATQLAVTYLGRSGLNALAALMGVSDVDPFIMGLTQAAGSATPLQVAAVAIIIAAASNNVIKGIYAFWLADRKTGTQSLVLLVTLAVISLAPIFWLG
jgi:uncharacterized membrane protein (DUF4010 family)